MKMPRLVVHPIQVCSLALLLTMAISGSAQTALPAEQAAIPAGSLFHTSAFYSQISRSFGPYRPYFRYDYVNAPLNDPIYGNPTEIPNGDGSDGG